MGGAEVVAADEDEGGIRADADEAARVNSWRWCRPAVELPLAVALPGLPRALPAEAPTSGDDWGDRLEPGERSCVREWPVVERRRPCSAALPERSGRGEGAGDESVGEAAAVKASSPSPCSRCGEAAVADVCPASRALTK